MTHQIANRSYKGPVKLFAVSAVLFILWSLLLCQNSETIFEGKKIDTYTKKKNSFTWYPGLNVSEDTWEMKQNNILIPQAFENSNVGLICGLRQSDNGHKLIILTINAKFYFQFRKQLPFLSES